MSIRRMLTTEQLTYCKENIDIVSAADLSKQVGIGQMTLRRLLRENGIHKNGYIARTSTDIYSRKVCKRDIIEIKNMNRLFGLEAKRNISKVHFCTGCKWAKWASDNVVTYFWRKCVKYK